jgi:hypothetical protein
MKHRTTEEWGKRWETGPHGRKYFPYDPKPQKRYSGADRSLSKALFLVIILMRTGQVGLNSCLYEISTTAAPTDRWREFKEERETFYHVLLYCPAYRGDRQRYRESVLPRSLGEIFTDTEKTVTAAKRLLSTGLLVRFTRTARKTLSTPTGRYIRDVRRKYMKEGSK